MTPKTRKQNLTIWGGALAVSVTLAFLSGIATHWPEGQSIDWRGVVLDVIQVVLSVLPVVAAGMGLPRIGKEGIAGLVSEIGSGKAHDVLTVEAIKQQTGVTSTLTEDDIGRLADRVLAENEARQMVAKEGR